MESIKAFIENVKLARKQSHANMTVFPLMAPDEGEPDYLTLEEAMAKGLVQVTEVGEAGTVPELLLHNRGAESILIIEGEELVGAKQNRIVNASFLIPGKTEMKLPVSFVTHGPWACRSREFSTSDKVMQASLRRDSQQDVSESMGSGRGFSSDQMRIWDDISVKSIRLNAQAPTQAMSDVYESSRQTLSEYTREFRLVECQVGAVFAINGKVLGMECFGFAGTFQQFFEKLVKSYALDALDWAQEERKTDEVAPGKARSFLKYVSEARSRERPSLGRGEDIRLEGASVSGAALVTEGKILHMSAFRKAKGKREPRVGFQRFSHRRGGEVY